MGGYPLAMATAAVSSPTARSLNPIDWMSRLRVPLTAIAVGILSLDAIGLAVHWADDTNTAIRDSIARDAEARITAPETVVDGSQLGGGATSGVSTSASSNTGSAIGGLVMGPVAPPVVSPSPATPAPTTNPAPAVPLAQIDAVIPGVAQISLGLGQNSCTTIDLTLLALGGCPAPTGDGPIILNLGGTLFGQK